MARYQPPATACRSEHNPDHNPMPSKATSLALAGHGPRRSRGCERDHPAKHGFRGAKRGAINDPRRATRGSVQRTKYDSELAVSDTELRLAT